MPDVLPVTIATFGDDDDDDDLDVDEAILHSENRL